MSTIIDMATYNLTSINSLTLHPHNCSHDFHIHLPKPLDLYGERTVFLLEFFIKSEFYVCCNLCDDSVASEKKHSPLHCVCMKKTETEIYSLSYAIPFKLSPAAEVQICLKK